LKTWRTHPILPVSFHSLSSQKRNMSPAICAIRYILILHCAINYTQHNIDRYFDEWMQLVFLLITYSLPRSCLPESLCCDPEHWQSRKIFLSCLWLWTLTKEREFFVQCSEIRLGISWFHRNLCICFYYSPLFTAWRAENINFYGLSIHSRHRFFCSYKTGIMPDNKISLSLAVYLFLLSMFTRIAWSQLQ